MGSTNKVEEINNDKRKKKKRRKKRRSYISKILNQKNPPKVWILVIELIVAFILDALRTIKNLFVSLLLIFIICGAIGSIILWIKVEPTYKEYKAFADEIVDNSSESTFRLTESSYIYDKDGKVIVKLKADQDSAYIDYSDIPSEIVDAYVAVEDRTFWDNPGIDIKGLIRVARDFIKSSGDEVHGASTITQQLARNIFLTHEVSLERKFKEMLIAINLTKKYDKHDIIEFYINDICYANAFYGIQAASHGYFNKDVNELSLSQMVYLCAIPNSPSYYDPYKNPERAIVRRDKILDDMLELGYITRTEYYKATTEKIEIEKPSYEFNNYETTYAIECAVEYLMNENGFQFIYEFDSNEQYNNYTKDYEDAYDIAKTQLYTGGYKVYTTIDSEKQIELQQILDESLSFNEEVNEETGVYALQGAMTVVDNSNGKVVAIIGGRSQESESKTFSLNRAFQSTRQPGSSIKPLVVYTPALENGYTPESMVKDISVDAAKEKGANVDLLGGETMTLRSALERSRNGVAWYLFTKITPRVGMKHITDMEFSTIVPDDYYPSASLGGFTYGVTTEEMAGAYSALANHGYYRRTTCIDKIIDKNGDDIYREPDGVQAYTERAADTVIDIMKGVITRGTASKLNWYRSTDVEAAAKTGTTNSNKDGWLCGVTPYYSIAVWVGYDQPKAMNSLWGNSYPGQIWKSAMLSMIEGYDYGEFEEAQYSDEDNLEYYGDTYYTYLEGRDDSEVLAENYTVADYRNDRVIGEKVSSAALGMYYIDKSSSNFMEELQAQYIEGQTIINTIYSNKYKAELQAMLDAAYVDVLNDAGLGSVVNPAPVETPVDGTDGTGVGAVDNTGVGAVTPAGTVAGTPVEGVIVPDVQQQVADPNAQVTQGVTATQ